MKKKERKVDQPEESRVNAGHKEVGSVYMCLWRTGTASPQSNSLMLGGAANTRPSPPIRRAISPVIIFSRNNLVGADRDVNSRRRREDETLTDIQFECGLCESGPIPIPPAVTAVLNTHPFFCIKQVRIAPIVKHERDLVRLTCTQKHTNYNSDQHSDGGRSEAW